MSMNSRSAPIPWGAFFFALLGLMWCGYIAFPTGTPSPCTTSGCALFRDSRIAGISLWWVGGAYFFLLAIVCLRANRRLAHLMAKTALALDCLLLLLMFVTAPCRDCLIVAAFFCLTFFCLRPSAGGWFLEEPRLSLLLPLWLGLFLGNVAVAAEEQVPLWAMANPEQSQVRIFFAPSCPACREALVAYGDTAALYPVEERPGDLEAVIRLNSLLRAGVPMRAALKRSLSPEEPLPSTSAVDLLLLNVHMLRNKASVLRQGFSALPLIQVNGMPAPARANEDPSDSGRNLPAETGPAPAIAPETAPASPGADANATVSAAPQGAFAGHTSHNATQQPAAAQTPRDAAATPRNAVQTPRDAATTSGNAAHTGQNARNATAPGRQPRAAQNGAEPLPWDVSNLSQCGQGTQKPCD